MKSKKLSKNLKVNDPVIIISGRDKGKSGLVKKIDRINLRAIIEGVSTNKKHVKRNENNQDDSGIIEKEAWLSLSKIKIEKSSM